MNQLATAYVDQPIESYSPHLAPAITVTPAAHLQGQNWGGRLLAAICLIPGLPLMAVLMVLVKLTSRGPALYAQVRVGRRGRIFVMPKIRSMVHHAESATGPTWARDRDPRVTPLGRFLRASHLDELPQLISVVKGEMAIFGPRPERPEMIPILARQIPGYLNRLAVLPGITGLAQINLPPDITVNCVRKKLQLDLEYVEQACWALDTRMFFWTLLRLVAVPSGVATRMMGLRRNVVLNDGPANRSEDLSEVANSSDRGDESEAADRDVAADLEYASATIDTDSDNGLETLEPSTREPSTLEPKNRSDQEHQLAGAGDAARHGVLRRSR